ncbi:MAG: RuBisCO large subunit C-terminal-like domain-containing protein [Veillonella sp.]
MCGAYTRGGADVIKDDHGISNQSFSQYKDRVKRCAAMVHEMNAAHDTHTLYAANVSGDGTDVLERAYFAKEAGANSPHGGLKVSLGFGWLHKLATDENLRLPIIHHHAYSGGFVSPGVSGSS